MTKQISCGDLIPGCKFTAEAKTEEELMKQVAEHAARDHAIQKVTPELAAKVKAVIRNR